ncbi:MAG: hypothetical protein AAFR66_22105 [Bacteroidota bacterium]
MNFLTDLLNQGHHKQSIIKPRLRSKFEPRKSSSKEVWWDPVNKPVQPGKDLLAGPNNGAEDFDAKRKTPMARKMEDNGENNPLHTPKPIADSSSLPPVSQRGFSKIERDLDENEVESKNPFMKEASIPPVELGRNKIFSHEEETNTSNPLSGEKFSFQEGEPLFQKNDPNIPKSIENSFQREHFEEQLEKGSLDSQSAKSWQVNEEAFPHKREDEMFSLTAKEVSSPSFSENPQPTQVPESTQMLDWMQEFKQRADAILSHPPQQNIKVTIGRVEVRAKMNSSPPTTKKSVSSLPKLSLEGYLKKQHHS